jgi:hypothetical protein
MHSQAVVVLLILILIPRVDLLLDLSFSKLSLVSVVNFVCNKDDQTTGSLRLDPILNDRPSRWHKGKLTDNNLEREP